MTYLHRLSIAVLAVLLVPSCVATVGHSGGVSIPKDSSQSCASACTDIGMTLTSVVIMANTVGCVCGTKAVASTDPGAAASAGMAAVILERQAAAQQQNH